MILLLDTSSGVCRLSLVADNISNEFEWQADRNLATGLLSYIIDTLSTHQQSLDDITGIGVFKGPGSFTGLRIGMTVLNTIADAKKIPIIGTTGDDWRETATRRLQAGENDKIVLPFYGAEAHITKPRK